MALTDPYHLYKLLKRRPWMGNSSNFLLSKWYLDCVDENGRAFLAYSARLNWNGLSLNYSSFLEHQEGGGLQTKTSFRKHPPPEVKERWVTWSSPRLGVKGKWEALSSPIECTLLQSEQGIVKWLCQQPKTKTSIQIEGRPPLMGLGYTEHLFLTIKPWNLPIDELRWGRFVSLTDSLVWIDWQGPMEKTLVFHNGVQIENVHVSDQQIVLDGGRITLVLEDRHVLRQGPILSTALNMIPGIKKVFPHRILQTYECKWRSRGLLRNDQLLVSTGWAIHEVVRLGGS